MRALVIVLGVLASSTAHADDGNGDGVHDSAVSLQVTSVGLTRVAAQVEDRRVGSMWTVASSIALGYRFVFRDRVELTPSLGLSAVAEGGMDGRSPWTARGAGLVGLTAGAMF